MATSKSRTELALAYLARMRPGDTETHKNMAEDQLLKLATEVKAMADLIRKVQAARQGRRNFPRLEQQHAISAELPAPQERTACGLRPPAPADMAG